LAGIGGDVGRDLDEPGVACLDGRRLLEEAGVDVGIGDRDALLVGEIGLDAVVDKPLEGDRDDLLALLQHVLGLLFRLGGREVAGDGLRADPTVGLIQAPTLDQGAIAQLVLGDGLPGDAPDGDEMVVVIGQRDGDREDDDRCDDDEAEAEVEVEVPPVAALPGRFLGSLGYGLGSKGHRVVGSSSDGVGTQRRRESTGRRVSYRTARLAPLRRGSATRPVIRGRVRRRPR
jgi:hypothetical protein